MKRYDSNDQCTAWFVIYEDHLGSRIIGYSDDKSYIDAYMQFHKCKHMRVKKITDRADHMFEIINENANDEVGIYNIETRGKNNKLKQIAIPMTHTEAVFVQSESNDILASRVDYTFINEMKDYLKGKYRDAIKAIGLESVIRQVIYNKGDNFIHSLEMDDLLILFRSFPTYFG